MFQNEFLCVILHTPYTYANQACFKVDLVFFNLMLKTVWYIFLIRYILIAEMRKVHNLHGGVS